jgi:hypothetical protein
VTFPAPQTGIIHAVRPLRTSGPFPAFAAGDTVQFEVAGGTVRGTVNGVDRKARHDLPLGLPYLVRVTAAPPHCGYPAGAECTIRAGCLERDGAVPVAAAAAGAAAQPTFLVAFQREGGNYPLQGALLVQGESLEAASAAAMQSLTAELEADVRERGELAEAMVLLLNASEVAPPVDGASVLASVTW